MIPKSRLIAKILRIVLLVINYYYIYFLLSALVITVDDPSS